MLSPPCHQFSQAIAKTAHPLESAAPPLANEFATFLPRPVRRRCRNRPDPVSWGRRRPGRKAFQSAASDGAEKPPSVPRRARPPGPTRLRTQLQDRQAYSARMAITLSCGPFNAATPASCTNKADPDYIAAKQGTSRRSIGPARRNSPTASPSWHRSSTGCSPAPSVDEHWGTRLPASSGVCHRTRCFRKSRR